MGNPPFTRKSLLTTLGPVGEGGGGVGRGVRPSAPQGGALLIIVYTWRLRPKGVPFCQASGISKGPKGKEICHFGL